jgi:hypothetical protein
LGEHFELVVELVELDGFAIPEPENHAVGEVDCLAGRRDATFVRVAEGAGIGAGEPPPGAAPIPVLEESLWFDATIGEGLVDPLDELYSGFPADGDPRHARGSHDEVLREEAAVGFPVASGERLLCLCREAFDVLHVRPPLSPVLPALLQR